MKEGDTNDTPDENKNQLKFLKAIMSANKSTSSEESVISGNQLSEAVTDRLTEDDFDRGLKIVIISDDEDAELEHISDMSKPSYDPRRYFSYKFRHSPTRMDNAPVPEETNKAGRYPEEEPTKKYTCVDESTTHDLAFDTRYPNYLGGFKFIKYPPLENVTPPEFQLNRPHYTADIEEDFNNFTPWRERAERKEQDSSFEEVEVLFSEDIDNATKSMNVLEKSVSEIQFSSETGPYYQEPATLISLSSKQQVAHPTDQHEFVNLNKMQRGVTFKSVHQIPEPLPCYSTDKEAWEYIRVPNTENSTPENQYSDLGQLVNPPSVQKQPPTEVRSNRAPLIYEDFKEHIYGPKPQHWIDFQEAGEIGKTVAIFDSRDFGYNNQTIQPRWIDEDFDFQASIPDDFHEFSKVFMTNIPFYDNESEEIQRFARQYKLLRAGPKYNIPDPSQEKKSANIQESQENQSDFNLQDETKQNDSIYDTLASKAQTDRGQDATNVTEEKPVNENPDQNELELKTNASTNVQFKILKKPLMPLKSALKPPRKENLISTDDESIETRIYGRSDIAGSINPTSVKRVTFKLDDNIGKRANISDLRQKVQFPAEVFWPTKILKRGEIPENNADKLDLSKITHSYTEFNMPTKRNEETKNTHSRTDNSVSKERDEKSAVKTKKPDFFTKFSELNQQQFKIGVKQPFENIPDKNDESLLVTKKKVKKTKGYLDKLRKYQTGQTSNPKGDDVVGKHGKTSESGNTKANKADKGNQNSKSKKGNQQKFKKSKH